MLNWQGGNAVLMFICVCVCERECSEMCVAWNRESIALSGPKISLKC